MKPKKLVASCLLILFLFTNTAQVKSVGEPAVLKNYYAGVSGIKVYCDFPYATKAVEQIFRIGQNGFKSIAAFPDEIIPHVYYYPIVRADYVIIYLCSEVEYMYWRRNCRPLEMFVTETFHCREGDPAVQAYLQKLVETVRYQSAPPVLCELFEKY